MTDDETPERTIDEEVRYLSNLSVYPCGTCGHRVGFHTTTGTCRAPGCQCAGLSVRTDTPPIVPAGEGNTTRDGTTQRPTAWTGNTPSSGNTTPPPPPPPPPQSPPHTGGKLFQVQANEQSYSAIAFPDGDVDIMSGNMLVAIARWNPQSLTLDEVEGSPTGDPRKDGNVLATIAAALSGQSAAMAQHLSTLQLSNEQIDELSAHLDAHPLCEECNGEAATWCGYVRNAPFAACATCLPAVTST